MSVADSSIAVLALLSVTLLLFGVLGIVVGIVGFRRHRRNRFLPAPETIEYRRITDLARFRALRNLKLSNWIY